MEHVEIETIESGNVISFTEKGGSSLEWMTSLKLIVRSILHQRSPIIVATKDQQLMDLLSDSCRKYHDLIRRSILNVESFVLDSVTHHATLVGHGLPDDVINDLSESQEFVYGNMWLLVPNDTQDQTVHTSIVDDVKQLSPSAWRVHPKLINEAVAAPAMYDGCKILWFNPDENGKMRLSELGHI